MALRASAVEQLEDKLEERRSRRARLLEEIAAAESTQADSISARAAAASDPAAFAKLERQITDGGTNPLADVPGGGQRGAPPAGANGFVPGANGAPPAGAVNGAAPPADGAGRRPGGGGPASAGVVTSVGGSTFTMATADGTTLTVTTSASTTVTVVKAGTLAALKVGDSIQVTGTTGADGSVAATAIRSGAVGAPR